MAARRRAVVEVYSRNEAMLRRTASRYSLCADDADDALQRALEILLRKAPSEDPRELVRWTQTVVKHEALAVRAERERILSGPAGGGSRREDWVAMLPAEADGPPERAERHEAVARSREALQTLKPAELRALTLLAEGYSYAEIGEITHWSQTKINRCLAEGRERFRAVVHSSEAGRRCRELRPLLSAFADGEAGAVQAATLREHLRACPHCRATLRAYRAAPAAAAALAPTLPLGRSLLDRAHDAAAGLAARFGGGADQGLSGVAGAGGTRGAGVAALAKLAAICVGTASGAAACVATGVLPTPLALDQGTSPAQVSRPFEHRAKASDQRLIGPVYETEAPVESTTPTEASPPEEDKSKAKKEVADKAAEAEDPVAEAEPEPVAESGAVEYAPPPAPEPAPEPTAAPASSAAGSGSPAGEFGP